jgi:hypothetical protein
MSRAASWGRVSRPALAPKSKRTRVDVAAAIQGVKHHDVVAAGGLLHADGVLLLLGRDHAGAAAVAEAQGEDVVRDHVQLLLLLALGG